MAVLIRDISNNHYVYQTLVAVHLHCYKPITASTVVQELKFGFLLISIRLLNIEQCDAAPCSLNQH